jgi:hypothetical protein
MSLRTMAGIALLALLFTGCAQSTAGAPAPAGAAPAASSGVGGDGAAFCAAFASARERLGVSGGSAADLDVDPGALGDELDRLASIAPAEIASDLHTLAGFWHASARGEPPTAERSEELRVAADRFSEAYSRLCR